MKQSCLGLSVDEAGFGDGVTDPNFAWADSPFNFVSGYLEALFTQKERRKKRSQKQWMCVWTSQWVKDRKTKKERRKERKKKKK